MQVRPVSYLECKRFRHQPYPTCSELATFAAPQTHLFDRNTPTASPGSCFASHIAIWLVAQRFHYLVSETPAGKFSAHWGFVYSTACMRQIFECTFDHFQPLVR